MNRTILVVLGVLAGAFPLPAQDALTLAENHIAAIGGIERITSLHSVEARGVFSGMGTDSPVRFLWSAPDRVRLEMQIQGNTLIQVFDGQNVRSIEATPSTGYSQELPLTEQDAANLRENAQRFDLTEYLSYRDDKSAVELLGRETVSGVETYKLRWRVRSGDVRTVYLDPVSFLAVRTDMVMQVGGEDYESETYSSDYREVGGVMFPFREETRPKGVPAGLVLKLESVQTDVVVPPDAFSVTVSRVTDGQTAEAGVHPPAASSIIAGRVTDRGPADLRVRRALESQGLEFEIDADGDYRVIMAWSEDGRSQLVFVNSNTETLGDAEIREVWTVGYKKETTELAQRVAAKLLEASSTYKIGAWEVVWRGETVLAVLNAKIPADATPKFLGEVINVVSATADETEKELLTTDDL